MKIEYKLIRIFLLPSLLWSLSIQAQEFLMDRSHVNKNYHPISVKTTYESSETEFDLIGKNESEINTQTYLLNAQFSHRLENNFYFDVLCNYVMDEKRSYIVNDTSPDRGKTIVAKSSGLREPILMFSKVWPGPTIENQDVEWGGILSPSLGKAKISAPNQKGNQWRGGYFFGTYLAFGLRDEKWLGTGKFYINHYPQSKKTYLETQNEIKIDPHTDMGLETSLTYSVLDPLSIGILGGLQRNTSISVKNKGETIKARKGFSRYIGFEVNYDIKQAWSTTVEFSHRESDFELNLAQNERELDIDSEQIGIALKKLF